MRTNLGPRIIAITLLSAISLSFGVLRLVHAMPPAPPTDACSLLSEEQVKAVLSVAVGAGQHLTPNSSVVCGWEQPGQSGSTRKRVVVSIYVPLGKRTPIDRFNAAKTPVNGIPKTPVSGVGDDALYATTPGFGTGLIFRKGDSAFDVRVYGFADDEIKAKEKTLAQDILAKL